MTRSDQQAIANVLAAARGEAAPYPGLEVTALSTEMQTLFGAYVLLLLRQRDIRRVRMTDDEVYLAALDHFGLACPHSYATTTSRGFRCRVCGERRRKL